MRLVRYLQHWLRGTGARLQVTDFVPVMHPIRQWADTGVGFSAGRASIATKIRYAFGIPRQGFQRRRIPDAMPQRQHTS
jgi:hypothetical protein